MIPGAWEELPAVPRESCRLSLPCPSLGGPGWSPVQGQLLCVALDLCGVSSAAKGSELGQGKASNPTHLEKHLLFAMVMAVLLLTLQKHAGFLFPVSAPVTVALDIHTALTTQPYCCWWE